MRTHVRCQRCRWEIWLEPGMNGPMHHLTLHYAEAHAARPGPESRAGEAYPRALGAVASDGSGLR